MNFLKCIHPYNPHRCQDTEQFYYSRKFPQLASPVKCHPTSEKSDFFLWLILHLLKFKLNRIVQYILFCVWLLLVYIVYVGFIHVVLGIRSLFFLLLSSILFCEHTTVSLSIILLMDIWIVSCLVLFMNTAVSDIVEQVFCRCVFLFLLGKYLGKKLLHYWVGVCLTWRHCQPFS